MFIYIIQNKINNKIYVGQTQQNPKKRFSDHTKPYTWKDQPNSHLYRSMKKYGKDNFTFTVIQEFNNEQDLNDAEEFLIEFLGARNRDIGYNIMKGGNNHKQSQKTKDKISKSNIGQKRTDETKRNINRGQTGRKHSEETKQKMSGKIPWNKNKPMSQETKFKLSLSKKGKPSPNKGKKTGKPSWNKGKSMSQETKQKLSLVLKGRTPPNKGKKASEETKRKLSESHIGQVPWNKGKKTSEETKQKISLAKTGKFYTKKSKAT